MQSVIEWSERGFKVREELSCSYQPSKKKREDIIDDYEPEFPSMLSDDLTDNDSFERVTNARMLSSYKIYDNYDNFLTNKLKSPRREVYTSRR